MVTMNTRSRVPRHKVAGLATVMVLLTLLSWTSSAQNPGDQNSDSPAIFVAHPWDPSSPASEPNLLPSDDPAPVTNIWTAIGPAPIASGQRPGGGPVSGRIAGIAADPSNANVFYIAAAGGGVWKTTDNGANWIALTDAQSTLSMGAIAVAPSNSSVIYAGTGEANNSGDSNFGRGVLVSTDGGTSWTLQTAGGAFDRKTIAEIAVDPTNANIVYVAVSGGGVNGVGGNNGVWRSANGGVTWTNTTASITSLQPWSSVRIDPATPTTLYAAVGNIFGSTANGVYKTTNSGSSWTLQATAPNGATTGRIVVAVSQSNSQVVYMSATNPGSPFGALFKFERSDNGGGTWTDLTGGTPNYLGGQGWYDTTLIVDPTNSAIVYAGGAAGANSVLRSTNSAGTWSDISTGAGGVGPHVDHHSAAFDANGKYLDGDDGGIYRYDPATNTWTQLNGSAAFLNTIQFQGIGLHPTNVSAVLGGSQDNGTELYGGTLSWTLVEGGDGGFVKYSQTNSNRVYHQSPVDSFGSANFFRRSDSGGAGGTWVGKVSGITDNTDTTQNFYSPFVVYPNNGDHLLYGARHLFESTTAGDSWSAISGAFSSNIDSIGISVSDPNTIYVSAAGNTFVTTNHGASFTPHNLPGGGSVADIEVDPSNAQIAYAVVRQFTSGGNVFRTTNGGTTWTNISGNLPSLPAWSFQLDSNVYYVGLDNGVYESTDGGTNWFRFGSGLPDAQVFQIELNPGLSVVGAATHGRGAWEILTSTPTAVTYTGDTSDDFHDPAHLSAVLTVISSGAFLPGATVNFTLGTQGCSGTTNTSGVASCSIASLNQIPGPYTVTATFAGGTIGGVSYLPSANSKAFTITKEETTLSYTGDTVIANGGTAHLSGILLEDGTTPIAGRTVTFTLGTDGTAQTCNGVTDATGKAACVISPVNQPPGPGQVSDNFAGDAFYLPSSASTNTILFAFLTSGAFVLGDQSAAVGTSQEFWGAQWWNLNDLSGGSAPASFKGFAETLSSEPPTCGITWATGPGNSPVPPATIPSYMGVLVASTASKSGSTISGNAPRIVVVRTNPGYGPDPGAPGTGTVVAQFCQ
jgi:hypothetical protein